MAEIEARDISEQEISSAPVDNLPPLFSRSIQGNFRKATTQPVNCEFAKYHMGETINTWWLIIRNLKGPKDELIGGEYLVRLYLPDTFPHNPPQFYFLTPNGIYEVNTKVCISIGEFHKSDYRGTLGIAGFVTELANGMIAYDLLGGGISVIASKTSRAQKKALAQQSIAYNMAWYGQLVSIINESYKGYSSLWKDVPADLAQRLGLRDDQIKAEVVVETPPVEKTARPTRRRPRAEDK